MSISLKCDVCGKKYQLSDDLAGKTFSCKECGYAMDVPGGRKSSHGEDVIARKPPKSSATIRATGSKPSSGSIRKRGKKSQNNQMQMLAVGGGVLIVVIVLGAIFSGGGNQGPSLAPPAPTPVATPPVVNSTPVPVTTPVATAPVTQPAATSTASTTTPTANNAAATPTTTATPQPEPTETTPPESQAVVPLEVAPGWAATVDPPSEPLPTEWATDWKMPVSGLSVSMNYVNYPATPSPLVVIGADDGNKSEREIWNLATGKKVATYSGTAARLTISQPIALSPDGKYIAWNQGRKITVYDVSAKKVLGEVEGGFGTTKIGVDRVDLPTPNRLVAHSRNGRALQVWSLPDGQMVHLTSLGDRFQNPAFSAFSPGGKYVAIETDARDHTIQIHEVETGNVVGRITVQGGRSYVGTLLPMAFSPDGNRFAAAFESNASPSQTQITIWNLADGSQVAEHRIASSVGSRLVSGTFKTTGLQWFADNRKLLVHGVAIVDAESGESLYQLDPPQTTFELVRRPIGTNVVADLSGQAPKLSFQSLLVTDEDLQRAAQVAAVGGLAIDVKLPPLTQAEPLTPMPSDPATEWRVMSTSPEPPPSVAADAVPLKSNKGTLRGLSVALWGTPVLFAKFSEGEDLERALSRPQDVRTRIDAEGHPRSSMREPTIDAKSNWIDVYDLATKQSVRKLDLPFSADLLGCSPNGQRLLVHPHHSQGRLDVLDAADGKPIVAFRPYRALNEEQDWDLTKAVMLDADHVATLNDFDLFAIWELPTCRPLCAVNQVWTFAVSPRGDTIALGTETGIDVRSALTGESLGFVPMTGVISTLAYHPQGHRLAVFVRGQGSSRATTVDLSNGQILGEVAIPYASERGLLWVSDEYVLQHHFLGGLGFEKHLKDLRTGATVWRYTMAKDGVLATPPIGDSRLWYAAPKGTKPPAMSVVAVSLPDEAARKVIDMAEAGTELLMKPGDKVAARFDVTAPPSRPQLENELMSAVHKAIERSGAVLAPSAPIELSVSAETKTGSQVQVRKRGTTDTVPIQELTVSLQLAYKRGSETLWQQRTDFSNAAGYLIERIADSDQPQAAFDKDLWERVSGYAKNLELPANLFSQKSRSGLGTSVLGPNGPGTGK